MNTLLRHWRLCRRPGLTEAIVVFLQEVTLRFLLAGQIIRLQALRYFLSLAVFAKLNTTILKMRLLKQQEATLLDLAWTAAI